MEKKPFNPNPGVRKLHSGQDLLRRSGRMIGIMTGIMTRRRMRIMMLIGIMMSIRIMRGRRTRIRNALIITPAQNPQL